MGTIAYGLRAEYEGTVELDGAESPRFLGGLIRAGERDFNVADELAAGNGTITVAETDVALVNALDGYPALKRVRADGDAEAVNPYLAASARDNRAEAKRRGITVEAGVGADVLADALAAHDAELVAGNTAANPTDTNPVTVTAEGLKLGAGDTTTTPEA